jgi:uncharacterized protein (DUF433 family)
VYGTANLLPRQLLQLDNLLVFKAMTHSQDLISTRPEIRFGKPCVVGTRIAVQDILSWLASGMTNAEILEDFPELTLNHIQAALAFAANLEQRTRQMAA